VGKLTGALLSGDGPPQVGAVMRGALGGGLQLMCRNCAHRREKEVLGGMGGCPTICLYIFSSSIFTFSFVFTLL
jgi:hypothetical protein